MREIQLQWIYHSFKDFFLSFSLSFYGLAWNSRFPWSCPKLPVQLSVPTKQGLHCWPYKRRAFPRFLRISRSEHLSCFICTCWGPALFQAGPGAATPWNHSWEKPLSSLQTITDFVSINLIILCVFSLLFPWFCIYFHLFYYI